MRLIVTLLLLTFTAPAWAEWVRLGKAWEAVHYYDPTTIKKRGKYVRVWAITDLKQRDKDGELSRRTLREYDCKEDRWRILFLSEHSERMARGTELFSADEPGKWGHIPPESIAAHTLRILCK